MTKEVDYSVLEGKEVKFIDKNKKYYKHDTVGVIIGCDKDIGITIVEKHDNKHYLLCHPGPSSTIMTKNSHLSEQSVVVFDFIVTLIKDGIIDIDILEEYIVNVDGWNITEDASQDTCSFY